VFGPVTRLLTKNLQRIPLLRIDFNRKRFKKHGAKNSCMGVIHPMLKNDKYVIEMMKALCSYIKEKYNMEDII